MRFFFGVPIALLGAVGYLLLLISTLREDVYAKAAALFITVVGFGFSAYLTYLEVGAIEAICIWCVASASIWTVSLAIACLRFGVELRAEPAPD
jgi:uncharacterized membrane protein